MSQRSRRIAAPVALAAALVLASGVTAGPDKIKFPADYKSGVLYATVDRYDVKQYRELYTSAAAVDAVKQGKPIPSGTVITLIQYKAQVDGQGNPIKDANGRFVKGDLIAYTVMQKETGWGTEYPADIRNGEWEYSAFGADGKFNDKANYRGCFECHKPHEGQDFVISLASLSGTEAPQPARFSMTVTPIGLSLMKRPLSSLTGTPLSSGLAAKMAMTSTVPFGMGLPSRTALTTSGVA